MKQQVGMRECERCDGTGWTPTSEEAGAELTRCECFLEARRGRLLQHARIPERYRHCSLSNFEVDFPGADAALKLCREKCEAFVKGFVHSQHGLLVQGPVGVGKTHLAVAVVRALVETHRIKTRFVDYRDLLRDIQDSYNPVSETSELQVLRPLLGAEVLLLDELGARRPTDWVRDTVTHILNDRYNRRKITLITTNYSDHPGPDGISLEERIGDRLRSRLYEMCSPVLMHGKDFRREVKGAGWR